MATNPSALNHLFHYLENRSVYGIRTEHRTSDQFCRSVSFTPNSFPSHKHTERCQKCVWLSIHGATYCSVSLTNIGMFPQN